MPAFARTAAGALAGGVLRGVRTASELAAASQLSPTFPQSRSSKAPRSFNNITVVNERRFSFAGCRPTGRGGGLHMGRHGVTVMAFHSPEHHVDPRNDQWHAVCWAVQRPGATNCPFPPALFSQHDAGPAPRAANGPVRSPRARLGHPCRACRSTSRTMSEERSNLRSGLSGGRVSGGRHPCWNPSAEGGRLEPDTTHQRGLLGQIRRLCGSRP
jgi:hypothetical protein